MNVKRISIVASLLFSARFDAAAMCAFLSRMLLLLVAIELVTMPITQHLWTWDKFLHGGHDFELNMLMIVTCICFVLLRTQYGRQWLHLLLAIGAALLIIMQRRDRCGLAACLSWLVARHKLLPDDPASFQTLPLLI
jgi:hypothetical protein